MPSQAFEISPFFFQFSQQARAIKKLLNTRGARWEYEGTHENPRDPTGPHGKSRGIPWDAAVGPRGIPSCHDTPKRARGIPCELRHDSTQTHNNLQPTMSLVLPQLVLD